MFVLHLITYVCCVLISNISNNSSTRFTEQIEALNKVFLIYQNFIVNKVIYYEYT